MSSIDPTQSFQRTSSLAGLETPELDPAALLLALSYGQMTVLQDSLTARVASTKGQFDSLGRIGAASSQLAKFKDAALEGELEEAQDLLKQLDQFRSKHVGGDDNKLVVNDAEQQDLADALEWAQQRGFPGVALTRQIEVPKPAKSEVEATEGAGDAEEAPVEMQTVVDETAFLAFRDTLKNYIAALKTGEVDNPAIRHRLTGHADYDAIVGDLKTLGITSDLDSPDKINDAIAELDARFGQIVKQAAQTAEQVKLLAGDMEKTNRDLAGLNRDQIKTDAQATDRKWEAERERLEASDLDRSKKEQMGKLLDALEVADSALERYSLPANLPDSALRELPVSAQKETQAQLANWQQDLNNRLESLTQAPRPEHRPLRPASTYV